MQSKNYTGRASIVTLISSSIPEKLFLIVQLRAKKEMVSVSEHIRNVLEKWIDAGMPPVDTSIDKFRYPVAAFFVKDSWERIDSMCRRRKLSKAHAIRMALHWYHQ
jgi:hypothetical protein